jgi:hypothetical protein
MKYPIWGWTIPHVRDTKQTTIAASLGPRFPHVLNGGSVEPSVYCVQVIEQLRRRDTQRFPSIDSTARCELIVLLASLSQWRPTRAAFPLRLQAVIDQAEQAGRHSLATAGRLVLDDWCRTGQQTAPWFDSHPSPNRSVLARDVACTTVMLFN